MPSITVGPVPTRISQAVTDQATIQNTGNATVYLDTNSAVSSAAYGISITPRASLNWGSNQELWAVTDSAESTLSVLYGGEGVTVSEVGAVVTGDVTATIDGPVDANITNGTLNVTGDVNITNADIPVSGNVNANITNANIDATVTGNIIVDSGEINVGGIETPVMVQGGGEILFSTNQSIAAGAILPISIPAPPSGLTYFGLSVFFQGGSSATTNMQLQLSNNGPGFAGGISAAVLGSSAPALHLGTFGLRQRLQFTIPMAADYPIDGIIYNPDSVARNVTFQVNGIAQSQAYPLDVGEWANNNDAAISFSGAAANSVAIIAPSFVTRRFLFTTLTASAGTIVVESLSSDGTPAWYTTQVNPFNQLYGGSAPAAALQPNTVSEILIPGTGRPHRIRVGTAITGTCSLSYVGSV